MDRDHMKSNDTRGKRAPYKRPTLRAYGPIARLTSGGSGAMTEGAMMGATMKKP